MGKILRVGDPRDMLVARYEIEKDDVFHMKNLYEWMHDWLGHEGWVDPLSGDDKIEHHYWERQAQNGLREMRILWRVAKHPAGNPYCRYVMIIGWKYLIAKKTDVVHKGQKVGTWKGDLILDVEAWIQLDWDDKWKNHPILKFIHTAYWKRMYRNRWELFKTDLYNQSYLLAGWVKQYLDMKVPFEQQESFHPVGGVGPNPPIKGQKT